MKLIPNVKENFDCSTSSSSSVSQDIRLGPKREKKTIRKLISFLQRVQLLLVFFVLVDVVQKCEKGTQKKIMLHEKIDERRKKMQ